MLAQPRALAPLMGRGARLLTLVAVLAACGGPASPPSAPAPTGSSAAPAAGASSAPPLAAPTTSQGSSAVAPVPVESNPPGDIPDTVGYVTYRSSAGHYSFDHPEGWVQSESGSSVLFTDKLNGISASIRPGSSAPTPDSARAKDVPELQAAVPAFELRSIAPVSLPAGKGVSITYRKNSAPDPVTAKEYRDEVVRFELFKDGRVLVLELYGAVGSDNVDPYRKISESARLG